MAKKVGGDIWGMLNSIKGNVSAADYPFVVHTALLLKWAEIMNKKNGLTSFKEIYTTARLAATYGRADGPEDVLKYLSELEEEWVGDKGGYIGEIYTSLREVPAEVFSNILLKVASLSLKSTDDIYHYAERFMDTWAKTVGKTGYTGMSCEVVHRIEKIVLGETGDSETVFDGFAGTGVSVLAATSGQGIIVLQELNRRFACLAEIMCILKGCQAKIDVCDSIKDGNDAEKYDKVIIEPPFSVKDMKYKEMMLPYYEPDYDVMCISYALYRLKKDGVGVCLSPAGMLFKGGRTADGRKKLILNKNIDTVIQLPPGAVTGAAIPTAILVLRKDKRDDSVLFIDASMLMQSTEHGKDFVLAQENEDSLIDIIKNRKEVAGISKNVSIQQIEEHEYSLVVKQYMEIETEESPEIDLLSIMEKKRILAERLERVDEELNNSMKSFL